MNLKDEVRWVWPLELQHDGEQRMVRVLPVAALRAYLQGEMARCSRCFCIVCNTHAELLAELEGL
jgi:hypothetical protein